MDFTVASYAAWRAGEADGTSASLRGSASPDVSFIPPLERRRLTGVERAALAVDIAEAKVVSTEVGTVSVTLDDSSTWTLTGDSYVTEFNGDAANVISNGYTLYVNGVALTGTK